MNHHDEYDNTQLPDYARYADWEPPNTGPDWFRGCIYGLLLSAPFWLAACGIVALVNHYIGGG